MPIYEYRCNKCNHEFEYLVFGGEGPDCCPVCKNKKVSRLMSACSFQSKGISGETVNASASASSCDGCSATSCSTCGH